MEPTSRALTSLGTRQPCSKLTPTFFNLEGSWFTFTPEINKATPPITLNPGKPGYNIKFEKIDNFLTAGIYGSKALDNFNRYIRFPFKKQEARNFLANKLVDSAPTGKFQISNLFSESDMRFIDARIVQNIKDNFLLFGAYSGAILGIFAILQLVKSCLSIGFNVKILHRTFGAGFHLLAALFGSVTSYLLANRSPKQEGNTDETPNSQEREVPSGGDTMYPSHLIQTT